MPNRQALTDGQLLSIDGTSLYHEATSHVGRRSRSTRAGAPGLSHRCADCAPSCSQRGRPGTPSPPTLQCRARRRSLGHHIIGPQRSNQRDALGCAKGQIKPMLSALTERSPMRTVGAIPSSSQRATTCASASPPTGWISVKPDQGGGYVGVACEQPCWGAGFAFGVVLPQAATCALVPTRRIRRPGRCQCSS